LRLGAAAAAAAAAAVVRVVAAVSTSAAAAAFPAAVVRWRFACWSIADGRAFCAISVFENWSLSLSLFPSFS
jgi:hypothetical protein